MAIARDTSGGVTATSGTSITLSYTITGSNVMLIVAVFEDTATSVTWNGTNLSSSVSNNSDLKMQFWYLQNAAAGTFNLVAHRTASTGNFAFACADYTGCAISGGLDATISGGPAYTAATNISTTTNVNNDWGVYFIENSSEQSPNEGVTNATLIENQSYFGSRYLSLYDSNGAITPAGIWSSQWSSSANLNTNYYIGATFSPLPPLVSVSDTETATDVPTLSITSFINVHDTETATESVNGQFVYTISVSDTETVTENINVLIPILDINVSDTETESEGITIGDSISMSIHDTETITESVSSLVLNNISVFDKAITFESTAENIVIQTVYNVNLFDIEIATEFVKTIKYDNLSVYDTETITENISFDSMVFSPSIGNPIGLVSPDPTPNGWITSQ